MAPGKEEATLKLHLLKVFSVLGAFLIWFYVLNSESLTVHIKMPLKIKVNAGAAIGNELPEDIDVQIQGPRAFIRNLSERHEAIYLKVKVNLNDLPVTKVLRIREGDIALPLGISVSKITPNSVKVRFEKNIKKYVPVVPNFVNKIDSRYRLIKKSFSTEQLLIEGPIETLRKISRVYTEPIDLALLKGKGSLQVRLKNDNHRVRLSVKIVKFEYIVKPKSANLLLKNIKIRFVSSFRHIFSRQRYAAISVLADHGKDEIINKKDVQVIADIPDGRPGSYTIKLKAKLPATLHLLEIMPARIKVKVH